MPALNQTANSFTGKILGSIMNNRVVSLARHGGSMLWRGTGGQRPSLVPLNAHNSSSNDLYGDDNDKFKIESYQEN